MPKREPLYPHVPKSRHEKSSPSTTRQECALRRVSIKRLRVYGGIDPADFDRLMRRAEQMWSDVVDLVEDAETILSKVDDPETRSKLADIVQELKTVQSFAFNLTEY